MNNFEAEKLYAPHQYMDGIEYLDLYAKTHALDIHQSRRTPENLRPRISEQIPERARGLAYDCITLALKYFEEGEASNETDKELQHAAQLLEKLYLNASSDIPNRTDELLTAALAYYLAGHYARAFVLMRGVPTIENNSNNLMRLLFLREIPRIKNNALMILSKEKIRDSILANKIVNGDLDDAEAIDAALVGTINRIYLFFHEYARTGEEGFIERAIDFSFIGLQLSTDQHLQEWWWVFQCTIALLREYYRNSLWTCLRPLMNDDITQFTSRYIKAAFARQPLPILELWRSQAHTIENIKDGKSYCLKMPTSSGKTRISELAILKFLIDTQDSPEKKCIYVAPYRALAVELEQSLRRSFEPIGVGVSQLYGSYDLNPAESLFVDESKILIATPEKMDAFLRYNTDIAKQVSLVIVDEGHIIDPDERGLRYELFLHRIIKRYERNGIRMLFISAVMPNAEQFAQWITGRSNDAILSSDWRVSQLLLGILSWDGKSGRIDYTHRDTEQVDQSFFITNYFSEFNAQDLKKSKCRKRNFPGKSPSKADLAAIAAIKATSEGPTLVFTPQKNHVEAIAKSIIEVVQLQEQINKHFRKPDDILPRCIDTEHKAKLLTRCIQHAEETTGVDSIIVKSLKCGFVIHHGGIPKALRVRLEELIREGILQLIVANTTLAQGVNLPIKTILIHSLYNNKQLLKSRDFWNLCGRAGRAMCETEGYVYLLTDISKSQDKSIVASSNIINNYVNQRHSEKIISSIRQLLKSLVVSWHQQFPQLSSIDISNLCQYLANNDERNWLTPEIYQKLRILDSQLLALIEEQNLDITDPSKDLVGSITDLFKDSMLYIQLNTDTDDYISGNEAISLIVQRVERVAQICKTKQRRKCYYSMGLSIEGCVLIEDLKSDLATFLQKANNFMNWSANERANYIVELCTDFLMKIEDIRVSNGKEPPDCWSVIIRHWLEGENAAKIAKNAAIPDEWKDAMEISMLIDNLCDFRLPWGLNAVSMFWKTMDTLTEDSNKVDLALPEVVQYFASMLRFGVHNPIATVALALGLDNRQAALSLSQLYTGPIDPVSILVWLQQIDQKDISNYTKDYIMQNSISDFIKMIKHRRQFIFPKRLLLKIEVWEVLGHLKEADIREGMTLLSEIEDHVAHLYTSDADYLGALPLQDEEWLDSLKHGRATITVLKIHLVNDTMLLDLQIRHAY